MRKLLIESCAGCLFMARPEVVASNSNIMLQDEHIATCKYNGEERRCTVDYLFCTHSNNPRGGNAMNILKYAEGQTTPRWCPLPKEKE